MLSFVSGRDLHLLEDRVKNTGTGPLSGDDVTYFYVESQVPIP
jgi:hypothetical protein